MRIESLGFAAALLLVSSLAANAQFAPPAEYTSSSVNALVNQVQYDLNAAYGNFHTPKGDRDRLNDAEKHLTRFSNIWSRGSFNEGELQDVISHIQHVLNKNELPVADRDALTRDMTQLRRMGEAYQHHEIRGAIY